MYLSDFPLPRVAFHAYAINPSEFIYSSLALFLIAVSMYRFKGSKLSFLFFGCGFFGYFVMLCFCILGVTLPEDRTSELYSRMRTARLYLYGIATISIEMAMSSIVVLVKNVHQMLTLRNRKMEYSWGVLKLIELFLYLGLAAYQTEVKTKNSLYYNHIVLFMFSFLNFTVYFTMYRRFRHYILNSTECSWEVALSVNGIGRRFGYFVVFYGLYTFFYFFVFVATVADASNHFSEEMITVLFIGFNSLTGVRFFAFVFAINIFSPYIFNVIDGVSVNYKPMVHDALHGLPSSQFFSYHEGVKTLKEKSSSTIVMTTTKNNSSDSKSSLNTKISKDKLKEIEMSMKKEKVPASVEFIV